MKELKDEVLSKIEGYLEGRLTKKEVSDWAIKIIYREKFDTLDSKLLERAVTALFELHDDDPKLNPPREDFIFLRNCLRGEEDFNETIVIHKGNDQYKWLEPNIQKLLNLIEGYLMNKIDKERLKANLQKIDRFPNTINGTLANEIVMILTQGKHSLFWEEIYQPGSKTSRKSVEMEEIQQKQIKILRDCILGLKTFYLTIEFLKSGNINTFIYILNET
ncbi:MAG: hypothetical protein AB1567_10415 [bacterium]